MTRWLDDEMTVRVDLVVVLVLLNLGEVVRSFGLFEAQGLIWLCALVVAVRGWWRRR